MFLLFVKKSKSTWLSHSLFVFSRAMSGSYSSATQAKSSPILVFWADKMIFDWVTLSSCWSIFSYSVWMLILYCFSFCSKVAFSISTLFPVFSYLFLLYVIWKSLTWWSKWIVWRCWGGSEAGIRLSYWPFATLKLAHCRQIGILNIIKI
jgi:hypothetical protein